MSLRVASHCVSHFIWRWNEGNQWTKTLMNKLWSRNHGERNSLGKLERNNITAYWRRTRRKLHYIIYGSSHDFPTLSHSPSDTQLEDKWLIWCFHCDDATTSESLFPAYIFFLFNFIDLNGEIWHSRDAIAVRFQSHDDGWTATWIDILKSILSKLKSIKVCAYDLCVEREPHISFHTYMEARWLCAHTQISSNWQTIGVIWSN